jgi:hypothetical protein
MVVKEINGVEGICTLNNVFYPFDFLEKAFEQYKRTSRS